VVRKTTARAARGQQKPEAREIPAYSFTEAARYLQIPHRTVQNWACGTFNPLVGGGRRRSDPLIDVAAPVEHLLSFVNMVELHVLDAIRNVHGLDMPTIRRALTYLQNRFGGRHPLADQQMETDERTLFIQYLGQSIDVGREGQETMHELLGLRLKRIERDPHGIAIKLFLFTRSRPQDLEAAAREPQLVAIDPAIAFGRPVIAGSRVPTAEIAGRYKAGDSIAQLVEDYGRRQEEIEEAIRCELHLDAA
jgi:uncharacterized protein (DUF433 family)